MRFKCLTISMLILALGSPPRTAFADTDEKVQKAIVVKTGDGKIVLAFKGNEKQHTKDVAKDVKIMLDGKEAKLEGLKAGFSVQVVMDDKNVLQRIEAHSVFISECVLTIEGMT